jgi:membrane-associated protein
MIEQALDILRNLETHLATFTTNNGAWTYALLFAIIFAETGLVIMPFLPGDSLLFTVGVLCMRPEMHLNFWLMLAVLVVAGVIGDAVNYHIGKAVGPRVFRRQDTRTFWHRALNRKHLDRAHAFYEKYGGKAVILGRFVPIVRTFVPFVAGAGAMTYAKFALYNVVGAVLWVGVCMGAGRAFGHMEWVKKNFEAVVIGIIVVSLVPIVVEIVLARLRRSAPVASAPEGS